MAILSGIIMGLNTHELSKRDEGDKADIATSIINLSVGGVIFLLGFYLIVYMSGGYKSVVKAATVSAKQMAATAPTLTIPDTHTHDMTTPPTFDQATLDALS